MKKIFYLFLLTFSIGLISCGGDDVEDCTSASINFSQEFSDELENITTVAINFANNPSSSNCNAYKDAIRDYIDALKSLEDCARETGQLDEYNESLAEYESEIDSLC